jgi:hypothetical protein
MALHASVAALLAPGSSVDLRAVLRETDLSLDLAERSVVLIVYFSGLGDRDILRGEFAA